MHCTHYTGCDLVKACCVKHVARCAVRKGKIHKMLQQQQKKVRSGFGKQKEDPYRVCGYRTEHTIYYVAVINQKPI